MSIVAADADDSDTPVHTVPKHCPDPSNSEIVGAREVGVAPSAPPPLEIRKPSSQAHTLRGTPR